MPTPIFCVLCFLAGMLAGFLMVRVQRSGARKRIAMLVRLADSAMLQGRKRDALSYASEIKILEEKLPWGERGAADHLTVRER